MNRDGWFHALFSSLDEFECDDEYTVLAVRLRQDWGSDQLQYWVQQSGLAWQHWIPVYGMEQLYRGFAGHVREFFWFLVDDFGGG